MTTDQIVPTFRNSGPGTPELAGDMLRGAAEIALFLYGDAEERRKVYHLVRSTRFPCFRIGSQLHARKSVLMKWIADQEHRGLRSSEDSKGGLPTA